MIELNKIHNEDCMVTMSKMPQNSIDFVLTDPPFNVELKYEGIDDNMDDREYAKWCAQWLSRVYFVLKEGSYAVVFSSDKKIYYVMQGVERSGLRFHHFLKWHKPRCQRSMPGTVFFNRTELAFILSKNKPNVKHINRKSLYSDTITCNNTTPKDIDAVDHPARRPVQLYRQIIEGFGEGLVYDPFMGSGTTALAAEELGCNWVGSELSEYYTELANERRAKHLAQLRLEV